MIVPAHWSPDQFWPVTFQFTGKHQKVNASAAANRTIILQEEDERQKIVDIEIDSDLLCARNIGNSSLFVICGGLYGKMVLRAFNHCGGFKGALI
ncbi:MAG: hypothetical protein ACREA2_04020 [Blastocatellia bacterium]